VRQTTSRSTARRRDDPAIAEAIRVSTRRLARRVARLRFAPPVAYVYNPLVYARTPHEVYLRRYCASRKRVIFLGMNPGPFGMAQTGVPFGAVGVVRDWLGIEGPVRRPRHEHPRRPVRGFDCPREEVSGRRLWGAIAAEFHTPARFFARHYVANYCPLAFVEPGGRNLTPDKLPRAEREALFRACDDHLRDTVDRLEPEWVVGVGGFAEQRAREALAGRALRFGRIPHPSPANPRAQRDWAGLARRELAAIGACGA
jgi:single-strand selective monofunctional uracil DNA glycosylase